MRVAVTAAARRAPSSSSRRARASPPRPPMPAMAMVAARPFSSSSRPDRASPPRSKPAARASRRRSSRLSPRHRAASPPRSSFADAGADPIQTARTKTFPLIASAPEGLSTPADVAIDTGTPAAADVTPAAPVAAADDGQPARLAIRGPLQAPSGAKPAIHSNIWDRRASRILERTVLLPRLLEISIVLARP